jgi:amidophosphoribosyltransferase
VTGDISPEDVGRLHAQRSGAEEDDACSSRLALPNSTDA